jgi:hypothetical protein
MPCARIAVALAAVLALELRSHGQAFLDNTTSIPSGAPFNASTTENVECGDLDGDGDVDLLWACGGAAGNEASRLWINVGGLQGGTTGVFADESAARLPAVLASSRDIDFLDLEGDGDLDAVVSNTSAVSNQSNRWWVNMGGAQGGQPGFFADQTASRWLGIGVNNGSSECSSIAPSLALAGGGYIDWSCDSAVADLDCDGDPDVVQATYGPLSAGRTPTRMFLNDGSGGFREFNPSCAQLAGSDISNGAEALWAQGLQQQNTFVFTGARADIANDAIGIELGDLDGDFDVDLLHGEKFRVPRVFHNRLSGGELLRFRDVTHAVIPGSSWAPSSGNYEQELGDLDSDDDLDVYGVNWSTGDDSVAPNRGDGVFLTPQIVPLSVSRHHEADCFDFDQDGDLDVFICSESASEKIYTNLGAAGGHAFTLDPALLPPLAAAAEGADAADVDLDGDTDVLVATLFFERDLLLENLTQTPDTHAPRVSRLEQLSDRAWSSTPSFVRAHVYDNGPWYQTAQATVEIEYVVGSSPSVFAPLRWSGGQVFRGAIPGELDGAIAYRVVARDGAGNSGTSTWKSYSSSPCHGEVATYCTAKANSQGCTPAIDAVGVPSASTPLPFRIKAELVLNNKAGLLFYGQAPDAQPFLGGLRCVASPVTRTAVQNSEGNPGPDDCSGQFSFDFNHHIRHGADPALVAGATVFAQYWYRDPLATHSAGFSNAVSFVICP